MSVLLRALLGIALFTFVASVAVAAPTSPAQVGLATLVIASGTTTSLALCGNDVGQRAACESKAIARDAATAEELVARARARGARRIVLFLPGFSTRFAQGMEWSQQLQARMGPAFGLVYVDWGTHGSKAEYEADARAARSAAPAFARFIEGLHAADPTFTVDVFAHSMGCRVATGTIVALKNASDSRPYVDQTVLAAPDVGLADYQHAVARNPKPFGGVTIYVSRYDKALALSSFVHLHHRLGQLAIWHKALPQTTVVDASSAQRMVGGHGYALYDPSIIDDIRSDFERKPVPHADWQQDGLVWKFVPPSTPAVSLAH